MGPQMPLPRRVVLGLGLATALALATFAWHRAPGGANGQTPVSAVAGGRSYWESTLGQRGSPQHTVPRAQPPGGSWPVVKAMVFFGRKRYIEILDCYLQRNLVSNGGILSEVRTYPPPPRSTSS
jgi:hypothetical protein